MRLESESAAKSNKRELKQAYDSKENEKKSQYYLITFKDPYGELDEEECWYETEASSREEAIGDFLISYPYMCYNDIVEVLSEEDCM